MEINQLEEALHALHEVIEDIEEGIDVPDDYKPIEEKIEDLRKSLKRINATSLTYKAFLNLHSDSEISNLNQVELNKAPGLLDESTMNFLINERTMKFCCQNTAIRDIIYKNAGTREMKKKAKSYLQQLFKLNNELILKNQKRQELMKKQYKLRLECHHALYDHQDFLKQREDQRNKKLEEDDPDSAHIKDKIDRSLSKIYTMKKLITNLIAAMCHTLLDNTELVEMLARHKDTITYEKIKEITMEEDFQNQ